MEKNTVIQGNGGAESQEHGLVVFEDVRFDRPEGIYEGNSAGPADEEEPGEEWFEAKSLLCDLRLLDIFLEDIERAGCVGDKENKLLIFLTLTSRLLPEPLSLIVKGESSTGKSYELGSVIKFFSDDQVEVFTRITPQSLYYLENTDLAHKGLVIYERHGSESADYPIRSLLSEKELRLLTVEKNDETGKNEGKQRIIKGPVAYIETTTSINIHAENETRSFSITIDDSESQTERIIAAQKKKYKGVSSCSGKTGDVYSRWKIAQELLKPFPVVMPFVEEITFPTHIMRTRRDHPRFLSLIETVAVLHQYQRDIKVIDGVDHIVADVSDYGVAYNLANTIIGQIFKRISQKGEHLVNLVSQNYPGVNFNRKMLEGKTGWDKETVKKYISEAVRIGYFEVAETGTRGRSFSYRLAKSISQMPAGTLISPEELRQKMIRKGEMGG